MVGAPRITRSTSSVPFRPSGTRASSTTTTTRGDTLLSDAEESADNTNLDGNGDETDAESTESEDEAPIGNVDGADEEAKDQADASDPSDLDSDDDSSSSESNSDGSVASILGMDTNATKTISAGLWMIGISRSLGRFVPREPARLDPSRSPSRKEGGSSSWTS